MAVTFSSYGADLDLICAYAPHSNHTTEMKESFYDDVTTETATCRGRFFIGGDFNARVPHVREMGTDVCGPYILSRGMEYLNTMNENTILQNASSEGYEHAVFQTA